MVSAVFAATLFTMVAGAPIVKDQDPSGPGHWGTPGGASFDCAMRKVKPPAKLLARLCLFVLPPRGILMVKTRVSSQLAYTFGKQLRPDQKEFTSLYHALDLNGFDQADCKMDAAAPTDAQAAAAQKFHTYETPEAIPADAVYVCAAQGDDAAAGTFAAPLRSIQLAADKATLTAGKTLRPFRWPLYVHVNKALPHKGS